MTIGKEESTAAIRYLRSCALSCGAVDSSMFKSVVITKIIQRKIDATTSAVARRRTNRSRGDSGSASCIRFDIDSDLPLSDLVRHRANASGIRPRGLGRENPPAAGESASGTRQNAHR